jgi:hypothetical protein
MAKAATKRKSGKPTKSAAIREYQAQNPSAGPTEVSVALKKRGIDVSPAHVSSVSSTSKKRKKRRARRGAPPSNGRSSGAVVNFDHLMAARKFAAQVGGVDSAADLVQALKKLMWN